VTVLAADDERPIVLGSTWRELGGQRRTATVTEIAVFHVRLGKFGKYTVRALRQGWDWVSDPPNDSS